MITCILIIEMEYSISKQILVQESRTSSGQKAGLREFEMDQLFKKGPVKENYFDLNDLTGPYNQYPEFKRLMGHLKRQNLAASRGQKTNSKEIDLFNHLYSMLKYIKYQQPAIQHQNLKKLEDWFMTYYRRTKALQYQIKHQNLDYQERNKPFRNRQAHEILKHYSKPYQICLKLFQLEKEVKKTKEDRQNQSIERCIQLRAKKDISKLLEEREQRQVSKTMQQFKQSQAKRRMIYDKIKLRYKNSSQKENQTGHEMKFTQLSKYSKSSHVAGSKNRLPTMVDYTLKKMNRIALDKFYINENNTPNNISSQSVKSQAVGSKPKQKQLDTKAGTFSSHSKRPEVSTAVGYRLMVNPFMEGEFKKKKK